MPRSTIGGRLDQILTNLYDVDSIMPS